MTCIKDISDDWTNNIIVLPIKGSPGTQERIFFVVYRVIYIIY